MILRLFFFFLIFSTIQSRNCSIAWRYNFHQTVQICSWISGIVLASNVIFEGIFSWIQKSTYLAFEFDLEKNYNINSDIIPYFSYLSVNIITFHSGPENSKKYRQKNSWNQFSFIKLHFWQFFPSSKIDICPFIL